jgi:hypothetical protein
MPSFRLDIPTVLHGILDQLTIEAITPLRLSVPGWPLATAISINSNSGNLIPPETASV